MYQKYTTEGFIVSAKGNREADMLYLVYTRDFGMLLASATSVRLPKSKLRPHLVSGVLLSFTFLRSKTRWKLVEVKEAGERLPVQSVGYRVFSKILLIMKTLIHGEEKNESLFSVLEEIYHLTERDLNINESVEILGMIKVLASLGYGTGIGLSKYIHREFNEEVLKEVGDEKKEIIQEINRALKATGF